MKTKQNNRFGILLGLRGAKRLFRVLFYVLVSAGFGYVLLFGNSQVARADYLANEFVTVWKTDNPGISASNQITIPTALGETYNYNVAWEEVGNPGNSGTAGPFVGDGTITFPSIGSYEVRITGLFPRIQTQDINAYSAGTASDSGKLLEVKQWGSNQWTSMNSAFLGAKNLAVTAVDTPDLTNVTDLSYMFAGASTFNQPLNNWNVSSVTGMSLMFAGATSFNQPLDNWNVSSVTDMNYMFAGATSFNQPLDTWNVSNVTDMTAMFAGAAAFNQSINTWNVSNVTDMTAMFAGTAAYNQPLNSWNVSNVTSMAYMFSGAATFNQPLNNWDVGSVNNMQNMFSDTPAFNSDISTWDVSNVTNMNTMFYNATTFNQPIGDWDVGNVATMEWMFYNAVAFNQPLNNWNVSNVTSMNRMFVGATSFNQPLNNWDVGSVTDMTRMFQSASAFNQPLNNWNVSNVTTMFAMFYYATSFNQPLGSWNVVHLTDAAFFLMQTSISPANFDNLLEGWSQLPLKNNVQLWVGTGYCNANAARSKIATTFGWNIVNSGNFCPPNVVITTTKFSSSVYMQGIPMYIEIQTADAFNANAVFTVISGSLPPGLQLVGIGGGKGQLVGTPTAAGRYTFTIQVYDGNSYSTQEYTITILPQAVAQSGEAAPTTPDAKEDAKQAELVYREQGSVEAASTVESGIINLANRLGIAPQTIINTAPWVIIVLLLTFSAVTGLRIIQQVHVAIHTKLLVKRQELLSHEKRSLLTLATHYLRTPMTIIAADVDALPPEYHTLLAAKTGLGNTIEQIVTGIEEDLLKVEAEAPNQPSMYKRSIFHTKILLPVGVTSALIVIINILIFTTTTFSPALLNLGAQLIGFLIVSSLFYISFSQYQQHKVIKNDQLKIVQHQEGLDSARNEFIGDIVDKLIPAVTLVEESIPDELDTNRAKYLHEGLRQLKRVTENFDLISKLDSGKLNQQAGRVSLSKTLKMVRDQQPEPTAVTIKAEPRLNIKQPEFLLNRVLSTVVENAVLHNKSDTATVISARKAGRKVKIDVKDFGEGIPKEKLDLLFKPLSRIESAEDFTHQGMGLSLYINSLIMHYLGGDITVTSKAGQGTTVHLELPRTSGRV